MVELFEYLFKYCANSSENVVRKLRSIGVNCEIYKENELCFILKVPNDGVFRYYQFNTKPSESKEYVLLNVVQSVELIEVNC